MFVSEQRVGHLREDLLEDGGHVVGGERVIVQVEVTSISKNQTLEKSLAGHVASLAEDALGLEVF